MKLAAVTKLHAQQREGLFHGIRLIGFTKPQEEMVRATASRVPPELMKHVSQIVADMGMTPKHGKYEEETDTVRINPMIFSLRQRYGQGAGWIHHVEMTMCHEFGHSVFEHLPEDRKQNWYDLSGWKKTQDTPAGYAPRYVEKRPGWPPYTSEWVHKENVKFTRIYAEKTPNEDFADCFAFYLMGKPHQMAPSKREFLRKIVESQVHQYPKATVEGPTKPYGTRP